MIWHKIDFFAASMTQQTMFGGQWTQQKLQLLKKYLSAYTKIFRRNEKAQFFETNYVDAFAGTGEIPRPKPEGFFKEDPELLKAEEEFRKGSVTRALEVEPPFDHYTFIEKDSKKCAELTALAEDFPARDINVVNDDANTALLKWCRKLDTKHQRAVVFLDPFGASVEWRVIEAIADTKAVDLWILFPYGAINRLLVNDGMPPKSWANRLTRIFGTAEWENEFYSTSSWKSLIDTDERAERVYRTADQEQITEFFVKRLQGKFAAVADPGFLYNSKGSLLFVLLFAAGNQKGANAGLRIANHLLKDLNKS
jgi:three-Cys-motif partner protein